MNIPELAKNAIEVIVPFLAIGGKEVIKDVTSDLYENIKYIFKKNGDTELLKNLEKEPNNTKTKAIVEYVLEKGIENNPNLIKQFEEMTKKIKETDDYKKVKQKFNSINNTGNNNTIIQGVSGNININKNTK